jgi:cytochrome b561
MASAWSSRASPVSYSASAKLMHWFVAAAVIALLAIGPVMKRLVPEGSLRGNLYNFHEALGGLVLIVMVVRLGRRIAFGVPTPDASMPPVEQRASLWAQYVLYVLLFVTTMLGWAGTNAYGDPVRSRHRPPARSRAMEEQSGREFASADPTAGAQDATLQERGLSSEVSLNPRRRLQHLQRPTPSHVS